MSNPFTDMHLTASYFRLFGLFSKNTVFNIRGVRGSPLILLCNQLFDGLFLRRITEGEQLRVSDICEGDGILQVALEK